MMRLNLFIISERFIIIKKNINEQIRRYSCTFIDRECQLSEGVMKVLNVAEKNDAAKNIAGLLSRGTSRRREGLSKFNKIYEFETRLWNTNCTMIMTSVSGHLLNYDFVGAYRKWNGCHPLTLFEAPVTKQCIDKNYLKIKSTLEREIRSCQALIIWTDCDREGENIGYEIIEVCQAVKPNIRIYRAKFSEITSASINRAIQTLSEPNKAISDAVNVRSELDLRIGAAFTRFQTLRLQKVFPQTLAQMLISYGSCQFPTLGFVVERFLAIERFKSEPYWKIKVLDNHDEINVEFHWARYRLFDELPCQVFLDICLEHPEATVERVQNKPKSKWRPLPLDTIELEKQGSRKLKMNAKETMKIAEKLYNQGFISYPRTETNIFPKELNLTPLVEQQTNHSQWGEFARRVLTNGITPRQGKKSDQAHPPIHPTKFADGLEGNEARVYEFVVRHFLACLSENAEGHETIVDIDIAGEKFSANGLQIVAKNYLEVYIYEKWNTKEIHRYEQGQVFSPTTISMVEEKTSPPNLLTEADLISLMDQHGIGTDATHAEHIETIKSRQYVGLRDNKYFLPGKLGIGLVMGYDNMGFQMSKPNLRAGLERDLKLICERQKNAQEVLQAQIDNYREVFRVSLERANLIDTALAEYLDERPSHAPVVEVAAPPEEVVVFKCPKCGLNMTLKDRRDGTSKYIGCMGYPSCNNAIWFPLTVTNVEVLQETCNRCPEFRKLKIKIRPGAIPLLGSTVETCIGGCDEIFNEIMRISRESVSRITPPDSGYVSSSTPSTPQASSVSARSRSNSISSAPSRPGFQNLAEPNRRPNNAVNSRNNKRNNDDYTGNPGSKKPRTGLPQPPSNCNRNILNNIHSFMCNCHEPAVQLTVRKDGPNQGRLFYKCAKLQGTGCDFFLWAEESQEQQPPASRSNRGHQNDRTSGDDYNNQNNRDEDVPHCTCRQPAKKMTVRKEGPNQGRQFWGCPQGMGSTCKFFLWADEDNENHNFGGGGVGSSSYRGGRGGRGGGRGSNAGGSRQTGAKRKCGICGVEGHTKRTCPQNGGD